MYMQSLHVHLNHIATLDYRELVRGGGGRDTTHDRLSADEHAESSHQKSCPSIADALPTWRYSMIHNNSHYDCCPTNGNRYNPSTAECWRPDESRFYHLICSLPPHSRLIDCCIFRVNISGSAFGSVFHQYCLVNHYTQA